MPRPVSQLELPDKDFKEAIASTPIATTPNEVTENRLFVNGEVGKRKIFFKRTKWAIFGIKNSRPGILKIHWIGLITGLIASN